MDKDWFGPHVGPHELVSTYRNATPQGMTNPPHSVKVKEKLVRDIVDYGVKFDHDSWPPPLPRKKTIQSVLATKTPLRPLIRWSTNSLLSVEEQRAGSHVTVGKKPSHIVAKWLQNSPSNNNNNINDNNNSKSKNNNSNASSRRSASAPTVGSSSKGKEVKRKSLPISPENKLVVALTRVRLSAGRADKPLPLVFKALDPESKGFIPKNVFLDVMKSLKCSLSPEDCQLLAAEFAPPTQQEWVCYVHFLSRLTPQQVGLRNELMPSPSKRGASSDNGDIGQGGDDARRQDGRRYALRTNALLDGEQPRVRFGDVETEVFTKDEKHAATTGHTTGKPSVKEFGAHTAPASFTSTSGQGGRNSAGEDGKKSAAGEIRKQGKGAVPQGPVDDLELRNNIDGLRSMGRLHNAFVHDRQRYRADLTAAGSMVLVGAGAEANSQGKWASDAAELTAFHNSAMRTVNPSGLFELKEPPKRRKKKDEDDLQLSSSGLFYARYPPSQSLKALKVLRRKHFPEEDTMTNEQKVASELATGMPSFFNAAFDDQQRGA